MMETIGWILAWTALIIFSLLFVRFLFSTWNYKAKYRHYQRRRPLPYQFKTRKPHFLKIKFNYK